MLPDENDFFSVLEPLEGARVTLKAQDLRVAENYQVGIASLPLS